MKKLLFISLVLVFFSLSGCGSKDPENKEEQKKDRVNVPIEYLDTYIESGWLNTLPEYNFADVEKTDDMLAYTFKKDEKTGIEKKITYTKTNSGDYTGKMKISFNKTTGTYIANIPKAFASHVDKLNFSVEPINIINPDPIVEFKNIEGEIVIDSLETKKPGEIEKSLEEQIVDAESDKCQELPSDEALACMLSLIAKYRDSEFIQNEISTLPMNELLGASIQAVSTSNLDYCKKYMSSQNNQMLCYEYAYQVLVKECNILEGKAYRDCVRKTNKKLPSLYEKRLFCGHINDEEMKAECFGTASLETCDDIANEEDKNMCKLNILRTRNVLKDCEKMEDNDYREMCIAVIGADRGDASICLKVKDDYTKGVCLTKAAMVNDNRELCSKIDDDKSRSLCNGYFITQGSATEEMCANEKELWLKETCHMSLAIINKDTEKCSDPKIVSYDNQFYCFLGMAIRHEDAGICGLIDITREEFEDDRENKEAIRDSCYSQIAMSTKNPELCEKIDDEKKKAECIKKLEEKNTPKMACADVSPAICPMKSTGNGGSKHINIDGHDVQCTYYTSKSAGYPLYNEVYKIGKIRDGSYKQYYKSGNIKIYSNHKDGRNEGFRIECSDDGVLSQCYYYAPGNPTIDCMT